MGSVRKSIIRYKEEGNPKTKYVDLPKIIKDDYNFEMIFGFTYPGMSYNESTGIVSYSVKGIKDE